MCRILLVDDEQSVLDALKVSLTPVCRELESYIRPSVALARAAEVSFDLVIADYRMPVMDGVKLVKALKKLQPGMAIILLSGLTDLRSVMKEMRGIEVRCYLTKPWNEEKLKTHVREALESSKVAQKPPVLGVSTAALVKPKGAMAILETKYPGITQPGTNWKLR